MTKRLFKQWFSSALVWGTWVVMLLGGLASIVKYHSAIPNSDDWEFVAYVTGAEPITPSWLWAQECEHRFPLTRLVGVSLLKLGNGDNWAMMLLRILAIGGLAFAMIWVAKDLRGWTSLTDIFFPLTMFQWGTTGNMIKGVSGIGYPLPTYFAGIIFLIMVKRGTRLTLGTGVLAGLCLLQLPLCGAMGLVYVPALTLWLGFSGIQVWRSPQPHSKRNSLLILALTLAVLLLVGFYFVGYQTGPGTSLYSSTHRLWPTMNATWAFLTSSLGSASATWWPFSGYPLLILLVLSFGILLGMMRRYQGLHRSRAMAMLYFLGAIATLALGIGWGRGDVGIAICWTYDFLPALVWPWIYFVWVIYRPSAIGYFVQGCLFLVMAVVVPLNLKTGLATLEQHHERISALEHDMRAGVPPYVLIARHQSVIEAGYGEELLHQLWPLRRAGIGSFGFLRDNPPFRELPLPLKPIVNEAKWEESTIHGTGAESYLAFALPEPMLVAGVRLQGTHSNGSTAYVQITWGQNDDSGFTQKGGNCNWGWYGEKAEKTFYVAETINQIRIFPDTKPSNFRISEVVLLIPDVEP
jgi:hypothetical protein